MAKVLIFAIVALALASSGDGHRILGLFPHSGYSHFLVFDPLMKALAERGHEVTVASYFHSEGNNPNYKTLLFEGREIVQNNVDLNSMTPSRSLWTLFTEFFELNAWAYESCSAALNSRVIDAILAEHKRNPFDLVILESFETDCMLGVAHAMHLPFISISTCALMPWHYDRISLPDFPSYIPNEFVDSSEEMRFTERFTNWLTTKLFKVFHHYITQAEDNELLRQKFGSTFMSVQEIAKRTSLMFVNQHYSLSGSKPLSPQVIEIGGIHIKENENKLETREMLPIRNFLDDAIDGAVLVSWGSVMNDSTRPSHILDAMRSVIKSSPLRFIIKGDSESVFEDLRNVLVVKWLPQQEILCHPNTKVFWSHGGLMGSLEAVHCGVPVVATPICCDQFLNAAALEYRGMGTILNYDNIKAGTLRTAINRALQDSLRNSAKIVSYEFRHRPKEVKENAVWWVEHTIATNGADLLKSASVNLSTNAFYSLDVIALLIVLSVTPVILIGITWMICKRCVCRKQKLKMK